MHMLIVLAAFAVAAVTPYLNAPTQSDVAQAADELGELQHALDEDDERQV